MHPAATPTHDAVVLAGGRSSRMRGADKVAALVGGQPLLTHACMSVADARQLVVVGPRGLHGTPAEATVVRESPPFGGPAAAIGAGISALGDEAAELVVVLAADLPRAREAVPALLAAAEHARDGVVGRSSDGHRQLLLAVYRTAPLQRALQSAGALTNLGVGQVTCRLALAEVSIADDILADVDTPADLERAVEWADG